MNLLNLILLISFALVMITNIFGSFSIYLIIILPMLILIIGFYVLITNFKNHNNNNSYYNKFK
ncbi:hypothetical protein EN823_01970 [bacterium M00.F.Ca.ET.180.01.1.1]|nr:hypothetical protein EN872_01970 [bacterium M00.F.Ca.ET.229.01.1.1]TGS41151.1 hypothetical protein EN823_01970 [bacterium M00.F.Ca.ET.180.01.1.1]TLW37637.1 hypothetical protein FFX88_06200 [Staphylococcus cohnii]